MSPCAIEKVGEHRFRVALASVDGVNGVRHFHRAFSARWPVESTVPHDQAVDDSDPGYLVHRLWLAPDLLDPDCPQPVLGQHERRQRDTR